MNDDCIFCKIIKGDITSYTVYEDDDFKAFLDINPITNGHVLLVPKTHYKDLFEMPEEMIMKIYKAVLKINDKLKDKLDMEGLTLIQNNGLGQDVKHYHLHLVPRYPHDDIKYLSNEKQLVEPEEVFTQIDE
jgi:histidine triad (HIT) family protein